MPADASTTADVPTFSWRHSSDESRLLRALVALPFGVVGSGALAVLAGVIWVVLTAFVAGNYLVALAALLVAGVSLARLAAFHAPPGVDGIPVLGVERRPGWRWIAAGAMAGLAVIAVGAQFGSAGFAAAVVATVVAPLILATVLASEGELRDGRTLTYCGTDVDLRTLDGRRRLAVGGYVAYRLSYLAGTATFGTPRLIVVPRTVDDEIRGALDAGVGADFDGAQSSNRAVRVAAIAFGLFFLSFGGFLLTVEPTSPNPRAGGILAYAAFASGGLGLLFLFVAARQ